MSRFRTPRISETFIAQAAAISAFIVVALVVLGFAHPVKAAQRQTPRGAQDVMCKSVSCRPPGP